MAVAGLHNVSVCDSAFFGWGDQDRPCTRASSILKMWRDLEVEHVMSRPEIKVGGRPGKFTSQTSDSDGFSINGTSSFGTVTTDDNGSRSCLSGSDNGHEDSNSFSSNQTKYLGESERKRVRQIFHEWKSSGVNSRSPNTSHKNSRPRPQWLGQSECERVRSVREWVQKGGYGCANHEGVNQQGSRSEHIQDGRLVSRCEVTRRRSIRKLCGREALHDMLARIQRERKKEILSILERRAVSDFAHCNRIQSMLRGRFLMIRRLIQEEKPSCTALSKLGLPRKINTVSTMRDGFKLKHGLAGGIRSDATCHDDYEDLKNQHWKSSNDPEIRSDATCHDDYEDLKNQHWKSSNDPEIQFETDSKSNSGNFQIDNCWSQNTPCNRSMEMNSQECGAPLVSKMEGRVLVNRQEYESSLYEHISDWHSRANGTLESWLDNNIEAWSGGVSADTRGIGHTNFLEAREVKYGSNPQSTVTNDDHEVDGLLPFDLVESSTSEVTSCKDNVCEKFLDADTSAWEYVSEERNMWQDTGSRWYHESDRDTITEQNHTQESVSHQEAKATCTWLDVEYGQEAGSAEMSNSFYLPDEESIQSMELRQLQKRRRVSGLLHSGFRERLDQLIQSFVQRQNDTSTEWEGDESSSSHASLEQEQDPRCNLDYRVQPSCSQELLQDSYTDHHPCQHIENPWEIIKELRTGMAMLHERITNMENMLETCMNKGVLLRQDC